ncbi:ATP-binding protein [Streptosporangium sp. NPDC006007]|uniref:ATP-binding protein n=1 Tax=Streptosporangium sp. NPDC006007 TaxID=3154575 RepID=UPI0033A43CFF
MLPFRHSPHRDAQVFGEGAHAPRQTRYLLRSQIDEHVTDGAALADLEVMVSELVTNAFLHAGGPCELRILHHAGVPVAVEIVDTGGGLDQITACLRYGARRSAPEAIDSESLDLGGRGLAIVAWLSGGRCGVHTTRLSTTGQPGESVWFAIAHATDVG